MIAIEAVSLEWLMQIILRDIQFKQQSWLFLISMLTIVRVAHISLMSFSIMCSPFEDGIVNGTGWSSYRTVTMCNGICKYSIQNVQ